VALFLGVIPLVIRWPAYLEPAGYAGLLRLSLRTFLASEIGTLVQNVFIDIPVFHALKKVKFGFLFRANASNILSWTFGTISFVLVSYWGASKSLLPVILGQTLVKFPLSFVYSWIAWLIVRRARRPPAPAPAAADEGLRAAISEDA
jgi:uncharacterized PurR-regulated membrane protein YhhQ (DUF165 family)